MTQPSEAVRLVWNIAASKARSTKYQFIENEHLFAGICSLEDIVKHGRKKTKFNPQQWTAIHKEYEVLETIRQGFSATWSDLRRKAEQRLGEGSFQHSGKIVHRSNKCKKTFEYAKKLDKVTGVISCIHLVAAIMKDPGNIINAVLWKYHIEPTLLWQRAYRYIHEQFVNSPLEKSITGISSKVVGLETMEVLYLPKDVHTLTIMYCAITDPATLRLKLGESEFCRKSSFYEKVVEKTVRKKEAGEVIKSSGDGLFVVFSNPKVAVERALEIESVFHQDEIIYPVISIHSGKIDDPSLLLEDTYRIANLAEKGHILVCQEVHKAISKAFSTKIVEYNHLSPDYSYFVKRSIKVFEICSSNFIQPTAEPHIKTTISGKKDAVDKIEKTLDKSSASTRPLPNLHYLNQFGRDLVQEALEGKLGLFIGRRDELLQVIQTLARKTKNQPVLVGEAGVGKTAVVEALAVRIAQGKDPHVLEGKRIIELNVGALLAGTHWRGDLEKRLTEIIKEARAHPEVILFIDEIHSLMIKGSSDESAPMIANVLKPALSSGDVQIIGASTIDEYRRYIEADPALERRFEKIIIKEPDSEETLIILKGVRPKLERHHQAHITDQALSAAIELSVRFDTDHRLPDKAIDLVDRAAAQSRIPALSMELKKIKGEGKDTIVYVGSKAEVTDVDVAHVLSKKVGVPLEIITGQLEGMSRSRLLELECFLKKNLIGQDKAVERVCQRLIIAYSGLGDRRGPLSVLLLIGPTGVGKTELARLLTQFLFGDESGMIRLDMSEYMDGHDFTRLIGSPPGYSDHEKEGQLTGSLRTKPYSLVLLDELEKAHPSIFDLFLQVFDEGRITDSKGRTVDARNAIFIMTANIMAEEQKSIGFSSPMIEASKSELIGELEKYFRSEFLNRIDEVIVFDRLDEQGIKKILRLILNEIVDQIHEQHGIEIHIEEKVEEFLSRTGYNPQYGVRELRRTVETHVEIPLSRLLLKGELLKHKTWRISLVGKEISITS